MVARAQCNDPNGDFEAVFEEHRELYGSSETMVGLSIVRDLLRLMPAMVATFTPITPRQEIN